MMLWTLIYSAIQMLRRTMTARLLSTTVLAAVLGRTSWAERLGRWINVRRNAKRMIGVFRSSIEKPAMGVGAWDLSAAKCHLLAPMAKQSKIHLTNMTSLPRNLACLLPACLARCLAT